MKKSAHITPNFNCKRENLELETGWSISVVGKSRINKKNELLENFQLVRESKCVVRVSETVGIRQESVVSRER